MQITVSLLFQIQNILVSILQILTIKTVLKITSKLPDLKCQKLRMKECFLLLRTFPVHNQTVFISQSNTGIKNEPQQVNISAFL
jgi:hypothetical protein